MITLLFLALTPVSVLSASSAFGSDTASITEWPVPWPNTRPRDPCVGPEGRIWFVGQTGDYAAYLVPSTGAFTRFELGPGTGPHNLIVDRGGYVWYSGNASGHIGRLDPKTGAIVKYPMPDPAARDPHTMAFDPKGDIWFTVQVGNFVGKLEAANGRIHLIPVPTPQARPYGIVVDARGRPWFVEFGTNKIGTIDPATMRLREYVLPDRGARPRRLALTSDGAVWYGDYTRGFLGRLDPATEKVTEWAAPAGSRAGLYAMTVDDRNRLWLVETGVEPNRLVGFDPKSSRFFSDTPIPSGGGAVRHMIFDQKTGSIWFGTDTNQIGKAVVE